MMHACLHGLRTFNELLPSIAGSRGWPGWKVVLQLTHSLAKVPGSLISGTWGASQHPTDAASQEQQVVSTGKRHPRPRGTDQLRGRVVLVEEHRTTRVSSAVNGQQPCPTQQPGRHTASNLEAWASTPPPAKRSKRTKAEQAAEPTQPTKSTGKAQGKAAKATPAPQPGRWLDRDCNAVLNMQRIGVSRWRPLELCWWPEQGALPARGEEDPGLAFKRLQD
ncbi:hypothetical protein QJQ45_001327 [Haematococcus lacustris]|nr:hypothetical protein QJQ45_001327 [Haematococcus lacustris]